MESQSTALLQGATDEEKSAYLAAIASIATADREATDDEIEFLNALCDTVGVSVDKKGDVLAAAADASGNELPQHLAVIKNSELRFSLVTDLITFAQSDDNYSEEEQHQIAQIAAQLGVNGQQFSLLKQYSDDAAASGAEPADVSSPTYLANTGLGAKMQQAGINTNGLLKGLLGFAGPMILASLLRRKGGGLGGALGGGLGGMLGGGGGLGGMLGGRTSGGGLGSIIGMLNGGRGMGSTGGLLGRILKGRF